MRNDVLVVSDQSAFDIEYLLDIVGNTELCAAGFETVAKKFNRHNSFNLPMDTLEKRTLMYKKQVVNAYFFYVYLKCCITSIIIKSYAEQWMMQLWTTKKN